jgi:hypothetical protein
MFGRVVLLLLGAVVVILLCRVRGSGNVVPASLKSPDAVGDESVEMKDNGVVGGLVPFPRGVVNAGP